MFSLFSLFLYFYLFIYLFIYLFFFFHIYGFSCVCVVLHISKVVALLVWVVDFKLNFCISLPKKEKHDIIFLQDVHLKKR